MCGGSRYVEVWEKRVYGGAGAVVVWCGGSRCVDVRKQQIYEGTEAAGM